PNVHVMWARPGMGQDFIFIRLLEPHNHAEWFIESLMRLLERFKVAMYCQVGSMYDLVPHTRPLLVTGRASSKEATAKLDKLGMSSGNRGGYQGPTSITSLVSMQAGEMGMETMSLMVHLPQYTQFDDDYAGALRLMETLETFYDLPVDDSYGKKANEQMEQINTAVEKDPQIKATVEQLESTYDSRAKRRSARAGPRLSPEVERFLTEMEKRLGDS
ncbi:MAG: PAC2 family protein, partial [Chloroflexi bacterium]|nr:PAC2 family protein [Chloroflexota bacterium]